MRIKLSRLIGVVDGLPVHTFFGAEGEEGGETTPPGGEDNSGEDDDPDVIDEALNEGVEDGDDDTTKARIRKANAEARKRKLELRAKEKQIADLQAKVNAEERKKNDDATNAKKDLEQSTERISKLEATLNKNLLETAILKDTKRVWWDVEATIAALPRDEIKVDLESGTVEGLDEALADVAKNKPFLVKEAKGKKKEDQNGSSSNGAQQQTPRGSSGVNPAGAGQQTNAQQNRDALLKRIPALRR